MSEDTTKQVAPEGTPTDASAQGQQENVDAQATSSAPTEGTPERTYAGKYKSADELEKAYSELQSKIGKKSYAETLGQRVVDATGYSVNDLENAGYSPDQIVQAVLTYQDTGNTQQNSFDVDTVKQTVQASKVDSLAFELELERFVRKNPESEEMTDWVRKMKRHPDYKDLSVEQIYSEIKPIIEKTEEQVYAKQGEKEKAGLSITHTPAPTPDPSKEATDRFKQRRSMDNAADLIKSLGIK